MSAPISDFFSQFNAATNRDHKLIAERNGYEVRQNQHYRYLYSGGDAVQGVANVQLPTEVQSPVVNAMLAATALVDAPAKALNLGLGCGAIERKLVESHSRLQLTTVEAEPTVVALTDEFFGILNPNSVLVLDARDFLKNNEQAFDLAFCDLAMADQQPEWLLSATFLQQAASSLTANGVFAMNLICNRTEELTTAAVALRKLFCWTAVYAVPGYDNVVLYASQLAPRLRGPYSKQMPDIEATYEAVLGNILILP